jgi:hypothetical protein
MQFRETGRFTGYVADVANWTDVLEQGCLPDPEHVPCTDEALYRFRPSIEDWYTTSNSQEYSCDDFKNNSLPWAPHLFCSDLLSEGAQLALALAVRGAKKSTANDLASLLENCPASCGYCLASNSDARELAAEGSLRSCLQNKHGIAEADVAVEARVAVAAHIQGIVNVSRDGWLAPSPYDSWLLGDYGEDCDTVCSTSGGFDAEGSTHTGHGACH